TTVGLLIVLPLVHRSRPGIGHGSSATPAATVRGHPTSSGSALLVLHEANLAILRLFEVSSNATYTNPSWPTVTRGKSPAMPTLPALQFAPPSVEQVIPHVGFAPPLRKTL